MEHADIKRFVLQPKAEFVLTSKKTGKTLKFKLIQPAPKAGFKPDPTIRHVLTFFDYAETSGKYIGTVSIGLDIARQMPPTSFRWIKRIAGHQQQADALEWFLGRLMRGQSIDGVEFRHTGKCGRCGRKLTNPRSIDIGLGPECEGKLFQ